MDSDELYEMCFLCMGTVITQRIYGSSAGEAALMVRDEFIRLENCLSFFKPGSDVFRINSLVGREFVHVGDDAFDIIRQSIKYSRLTRGLFDITSGPLIKRYGVMTESARVVSRDEAVQALKLINYNDILKVFFISCNICSI